MPLLPNLLGVQLLASRGNLANQPPLAAQQQATAIANYWSTGIGPVAAVVISPQTIPVMQAQITPTYASLPASSAIAAKKIAAAVDAGAKALILTGPLYGLHIAMITPGPGGLASELTNIFDSKLPVAVMAKKEAKAYDNYTKTLIASGTGNPAIPVAPQQGPII